MRTLIVGVLALTFALAGCHLEIDAQGQVWVQCDASDYTSALDMGGDLYYTPNSVALLAGCYGGYLFGGGPPGPGDHFPRFPL